MKFKSLMKYLPALFLGYFSLEILIWRWFDHQIPTQIPGWIVYALLVLNLVYIAFSIASYWRFRASG